MSLYNIKVIEYDDFIHIQHYDKPIKRADLPEKIQKDIDNEDIKCIKSDKLDLICEDEDKKNHSLSVSTNRSKNNLFRIARSNDWDLFVTLTFDREIIDSSDYDLISKKMTTWINNIKSRYCHNLKYLTVPELHKDKIHYHFHCLFANIDNLTLIDSGHIDKLGSKIYNLPEWKYGFSTATFVKDKNKVRNYIGKYITKDLMNNLKYKKRYYCSQNVNVNPEKYYYGSLEDIYNIYGENISYIKTTHVNGFNRVQYFEIKK